MPGPAGSYQRIYAVVSRIPRGRVATYGQVARLVGLTGQARLVGYALSALDDRSRIPWHRVVNARGQISGRRDAGPEGILQRLRLERERVRFDARSSIALDLFRWRPQPKGSRPADDKTSLNASSSRMPAGSQARRPSETARRRRGDRG